MEKNERLAEMVTDIILQRTCCDYHKDEGSFSYEIYPDYSDYVRNETIIKWCKADDPRDAFYQDISEWFMESVWSFENEVIECVKDSWNFNEFPYDENQEFIEDWIKEHIAVDLPYEHYLRQSVCVNIIVDTGDENYDYVSNDVYPHYNAKIKDVVPEEASILWLVRQQGYKKRQLNKALRCCEYSGSDLLKSIRTEVLNCSTHMNALTFFVEMTVEQLFDLQEALKDNGKDDPTYEKNKYICVWERKGRRNIVIDKSAICGLYDNWNGAGSILEIKLEKDVKLPMKYISTAWPDGGRGYAATEVYGICRSMWTPTLKKIA